MEGDFFLERSLETPAFIIDFDTVRTNLQLIAALCKGSGCNFLYSIKALPLQSVLQLAAEYVDGFSVSSLFEARMAASVTSGRSSLHLTTPGLRTEEFSELSRLCTHISFNSLSQFERLQSIANEHFSGLRINPKLSFISDDRYNPCRRHSKLGIEIDFFDRQPLPLSVTGLHVHTVFKGMDYEPLVQTMGKIKKIMPQTPGLIKWINFGGGYLNPFIKDQQPFIALVKQWRQQFGVELFIEPGNAVVGRAGYLVSRVIDRIKSDDKVIVVLDTSVNHLPEVFEYQVAPPLLHPPPGDIPVILAGSTCLAGDVFGQYYLRNIPRIGDRLVFEQVGAYSLPKAHRFNGYNLPTLYSVDRHRLRLLKRFGYEDFRRYWTSA